MQIFYKNLTTNNYASFTYLDLNSRLAIYWNAFHSMKKRL